MDKNNEGELTEKEQVRFKTLLDEVQKITLYNSKMLVEQKRRRESKHGKVVTARWWLGGRESRSVERTADVSIVARLSQWAAFDIT
jgi:hypothetical protein